MTQLRSDYTGPYMIPGGRLIPVQPDSDPEHEQEQLEGHEQGPQSQGQGQEQQQEQLNPHFEDARTSQQGRGFNFHDLFVKWLLDRNVDIYSTQYCTPEGYIEPDPYDFPDFLAYAHEVSNIMDAEEDAMLRLSHSDFPHTPQDNQAFHAGMQNARASYQVVEWQDRGPTHVHALCRPVLNENV